MFPVPTRCVVPNPVFLGGLGNTPSATALVDQDAAVSSLRFQRDSIKAQWNLLPTTWRGSQRVKRGKRSYTTYRWDVPKSKACSYYPVVVPSSNNYMGFNDAKQAKAAGKKLVYVPAMIIPQIQQACMLKGQLDDIEKRLKAAEESAWARLTKDLPYKSAIIKPRKSGDKIIYAVQEYATGKAIGTGQSMEEAKALVDNKIAAEQEKEVQRWQEERVQQAQAAQQGPGLPSTVSPQAVSSTKKKLVLGGAAAAAALLLLR